VYFPSVYKSRSGTGHYNVKRILRDNWSGYIAYSSRQRTLFWFFIKPKLSIRLVDSDENTEIRWSPLTETRETYDKNGDQILPPFRFYPLRSFVNVTVENKGRVANNCEVTLKLLHKTNGCQALSPEDKTLMWNDTLENKTSISAKYGRKTFTLAFSQEKFTVDQVNAIGTLNCGITGHYTRLNTWIGTKRALIAPENYNQDSLCQGEFMVHVDVIMETGQKVSSHFVIKVGHDWKNLTAEMNICNCATG
jgi:hypothetical protein